MDSLVEDPSVLHADKYHLSIPLQQYQQHLSIYCLAFLNLESWLGMSTETYDRKFSSALFFYILKRVTGRSLNEFSKQLCPIGFLKQNDILRPRSLITIPDILQYALLKVYSTLREIEKLAVFILLAE